MQRPKVIEFQGRKYTLSGRYYRRNVWGSDGPTSLHRAIWESAHGPIPKGYDIHHKDGDCFNNAVENLEKVESREHVRAHTLERIKSGELGPPSDKAREAAAEWHASPEGLEWHRKNGVEAWKSREWHLCECHNCGAKFMSPYPTRAKWCHLNCKMEALRKRRGKPVGTRPHRKKAVPIEGKRKPVD